MDFMDFMDRIQVNFRAAKTRSLTDITFLAYTVCRLREITQRPSSAPSLRTDTYPHCSRRYGIKRLFFDLSATWQTLRRMLCPPIVSA